MAEAYTPQSRLLAQLLSQRKNPVQSIGQGLADVAGDIGAAYYLKKDQDRADEKEKDRARVMAEIFATAANPNLTNLQAATAQGMAPEARQAFPGGMTSAAEMMAGAAPNRAQTAFAPEMMQTASPEARKLAAYMQGMRQDPAAAMAALPNIEAVAGMFEGPKPKILPSMKPGEQLPMVGPDGNITFKTAPGTPATAAKNGSWVMSLETGKPVMKTDEEVMANPGAFAPVPNGMRITSDGQGGFEITTGGLEPKMSNATATKIEDVILNARDSLARIASIKQGFKPEYQQLGTRAAMMAASAKSKAGMQLQPQEETALKDFASYRRDASSNLNTMIKNATGATVSQDEAPRLMQEIPNPGSGLFDGDDAVTFQAKLDGAERSLKSALARAEYARKNGLTKEAQFAIPLDSIPTIIQKKGDQYKADLLRANPQAEEAQVDEMVKNRLREEFGL